MKKNSTVVLQIVIFAFGLFVLGFMLWEPTIEGRNVNATLSEIYFNDPFLAWAYLASLSFFTALWQGIKLLSNIGRNETFSKNSVRNLQVIKYCAYILVGFALVGEAWLFLFNRTKDDITGGVFMGLLMILFSGVVVITANIFEKIVRGGIVR